MARLSRADGDEFLDYRKVSEIAREAGVTLTKSYVRYAALRYGFGRPPLNRYGHWTFSKNGFYKWLKERGAQKGESAPPGFLSIKDAAAQASMSANTLYYWVRRGWIPSERVGLYGLLCVRLSDVEAYKERIVADK